MEKSKMNWGPTKADLILNWPHLLAKFTSQNECSKSERCFWASVKSQELDQRQAKRQLMVAIASCKWRGTQLGFFLRRSVVQAKRTQ